MAMWLALILTPTQILLGDLHGRNTLAHWDGMADPNTILFACTGVVVIIPIVLAYQAHAYWVFRGKAKRLHDYGGDSQAMAAFAAARHDAD